MTTSPVDNYYGFIPNAQDNVSSVENDNNFGFVANEKQSSVVPKIMQEIKNLTQPNLRTPQMQEEFSNPIERPGFQQLPQQQQLEKIKFSAFDPSNLTGLGGYVPPGTYEQPATRIGQSIAATALGPEIALGGRFLAPVLNSLARIGKGTGASLAYQAPEIQNQNQLEKLARHAFTSSAILEGLTYPLRGIGRAAEIANPIEYATNKTNQIQNEYRAAKEAQKEAYELPLQRHGETNVTMEDPEKYLGFSKLEIKRFPAETKKSYDEFIASPTLNNLNSFKIQSGKEWANLATNTNKYNTAQNLRMARNLAKQKLYGFLEKDPEALASYKKGDLITEEHVSPYESDEKLRNIAEGIKRNVKPQELADIIKKGTETVIYRKNKNAVTAIPKEHSLTNHMKDLENVLNLGDAVQHWIPPITGSLTGALSGNAVGGPLGALTGAAGGAYLSHLLAPRTIAGIQNPLVNNIIKKGINPLYYGLGRGHIAEQNE